MDRPAEDAEFLGDAGLGQLLLEPSAYQPRRGVRVRQRDDLFRRCGRLDDVDELAGEQGRLARPGSGVDIDDVGTAEDGVTLLLVELLQVVRLYFLSVLHNFVMEINEKKSPLP